jgi:uncharacterized protein
MGSPRLDPVAALSDPSTYGTDEEVEVRETHISWVFLTGDRAYKVKKPLRLPFVDYSSLERRLGACEAEVRLNRRLAPDVYLGVRGLVPGDGGARLAGADHPDAVEYMVEMRRFNDDDTLAAMVRTGEADRADVARTGELLAAFHAAAPPAERPDGAEAVKRAYDDTLASLRSLLSARQAPVVAAESFATAFLAARWLELDLRASAGLVREGHGDLRAEHVLPGDPPRIVDCVEFNRELREIDVGADLAFLVMDLHRLGRPDLAVALLNAYREAGGDPGDDALLAFHAGYRARVRAKVRLLRARQLDEPAAGREREEARHLLALAATLDWAARSPLVLAIGGVSASGKSALASALAAESGYTLVSSDVTRKAAAGLSPVHRGSAGLYDARHDRDTYRRMASAAAHASERGGVIVDATLRRRWHRDALREALADRPLFFVECRAPTRTLLERAVRRRRAPSISDASPEVVMRQLRDREPYDEIPAEQHVVVRTDRDVGAAAAQVVQALDQRWTRIASPPLRG